MRPGLFVYGTLHPDRAPDEIRSAVERLGWLGKGSVRGELHELGEYPALVPARDAAFVQGDVFDLPDDPELLATLDVYEGYDPACPETSLFVRVACDVLRWNGVTERHWVYVYNRELPTVGESRSPMEIE